MLVCGVDEAGRGSLAGPLVVGAVALEEASTGSLVDLGVKDSKSLSPRKRELLYCGIRDICKVEVLYVPPEEIDRYVFTGRRLRRLNYLEAIYMARAIGRLNAGVAYADACDPVPRRFSQHIRRNLTIRARVIAEHYADSTYPVVSAASIVAKVERDMAVERLRNEFGDFGSGYPSDHRTIAFMKEWLQREHTVPAFCRASWKTWETLSQTRLDQTSRVS